MRRSEIKIVHILKATGVCGTENHLLKLLPELDKRFNIHVVLLLENNNPVAEFRERLKKSGIRVHTITIRHHLDLLVIWKIYSTVKRIEPDIVHTHLIHGDLYGTIASRMAGVTRIVSSKHNPDPFRKNLLFRLLNKSISRYHRRVIAISDSLKDFLHETEGIDIEKITVIKYGLDCKQAETDLGKSARIESLRSEFRIPDDRVIIGNVARLIPQKGHLFLIEAFRRLVRDGLKIVLVIVGDGYLRERLEREVTRKGLEDSVFFTGFRSDAVRLIAGFDIFVFPSIWEGFGLVLLEAMSWRKPVVASNVGAIPEIVVDGETGILVKAYDISDLKEAMRRLVESSETRNYMGRKGYERLLSQFSVEKMVKKTESIYFDLIGKEG
nr:glycosyltransferase [Desulfobacterales bacterium]